MRQLRKRLTYANVMSSIAVFLVLGGATAIAVTKVPNKSVGTKQLKANAVTTAKLKKNVVTTAKIKNGAVTGAKVNLGTLGTVPNSATTDVVKRGRGTLSVGQQATVLDYGGVKLIVKCQTFEATKITAMSYIESSADGTTFISWEDGSKSIGPATPENEREVADPQWADSNGPIGYEGGAQFAFTAAGGASFAGGLAIASEKDSGTCWYWLHGTVIS